MIYFYILAGKIMDDDSYFDDLSNSSLYADLEDFLAENNLTSRDWNNQINSFHHFDILCHQLNDQYDNQLLFPSIIASAQEIVKKCLIEKKFIFIKYLLRLSESGHQIKNDLIRYSLYSPFSNNVSEIEQLASTDREVLEYYSQFFKHDKYQVAFDIYHKYPSQILLDLMLEKYSLIDLANRYLNQPCLTGASLILSLIKDDFIELLEPGNLHIFYRNIDRIPNIKTLLESRERRRSLLKYCVNTGQLVLNEELIYKGYLDFSDIMNYINEEPDIWGSFWIEQVSAMPWLLVEQGTIEACKYYQKVFIDLKEQYPRLLMGYIQAIYHYRRYELQKLIMEVEPQLYIKIGREDETRYIKNARSVIKRDNSLLDTVMEIISLEDKKA